MYALLKRRLKWDTMSDTSEETTLGHGLVLHGIWGQDKVLCHYPGVASLPAMEICRQLFRPMKSFTSLHSVYKLLNVLHQ